MAQNHQVRMSLMFDADTSRAKASLRDLQSSLNGLTNNIAAGDFPMTGKIQEAYVAAEKLKKVLNASVNMQTGQFDISKFNSQLKQAGLSVQSLGQKMSGAGMAGAQSFTALATAISNAEIPTRRMNALVDNLARSLKQTAQWQLSSSVIHGVTGALQQAYGYAQDLNQSLTDIRIVTGENMDFMERYATQANKAAKALSATTNEYAKASLIFYQQGLDEDQVSQRTAAAIKMANVTGESAKDISSYMTAIWNNFDNGTKSLEYYADAITALGAATASSTEEIAGGMQQFASIAETVGLSYEYAASALATVVSATRQSEETVGTSFKTIFARLSSLQLGETLEDGTTLTKYSDALSKVGIKIMDSNGELKSMDKILDELGAKWNSISKEQQNALAYTVAGTRQYNNFISLLDNYENFKINVDLAIDSEGTLEEQQKIYAESWEAAANRAKAAAESIYEKLLDDDFFITMLNGLEKLLTGIDKFIDALGGLPGILSVISSLMLRIFNTQATEAVRNMTYGLKNFMGLAAAEAGKTKAEFMVETRKVISRSRQDVGNNAALNTELDMLEKKIELEQTYLQYEDTLSQKQKNEYSMQLQLLEVLREQSKEKQKQAEQAKENLSKAAMSAMVSYEEVGADDFDKKKKLKEEAAKAAEAASEKNAELDIISEDIETQRSIAAKAEVDFQRQAHELASLLGNTGDTKGTVPKNADGSFSMEIKRPTAAAEADQAILDKKYAEVMAAAEKVRQARNTITELETEAESIFEQATNSAGMAVQLQAQADEAKPADRATAKLELERYLSYSSGAADQYKQELNTIVQEYQALQDTDVTDPNYEEALKKLQSHLASFTDEYQRELGETTNQIIATVVEELKKNPEDIQISGADFQAQIDAAHQTDTERYAKEDAAEIRAAMEQEVGAKFSDQAFEKISDALEDSKKKVQEGEAALKNYNDTLEDTKQGLEEKVGEKMPDAAESFVNLTTGITNAAAALSAFKGIFDVWSNSDMSFGEKLLSTFTSMGVVLGSVVSAISAFQAINIKAMATSVKDTIITWANVLAHKASEKARKAEAMATKLNATNTSKQSAATTVDTGTKVASTVAEKSGKTGGKIIAGGGKAMASGAAGSGTAAGSSAISSLGPALAKIAAVAVPVLIAVAAISAAIAISVSVYNQAENAAKRAEKQAEILQNRAAEVKEEYNQVKESIEGFDSVQEKMKSLVKDTQEWRDALAESNEYARNLIEEFGDTLSVGDYYFENGEIKFKDGVLEQLEQKKFEEKQRVDTAADAAKLIAKESRMDADTIKFARKNMRTGTAGGDAHATWGATTAGGAIAGAAIGSMIPVVGTLVGAGVGAVVGLLGGVISTSIAGSMTEAEIATLEKVAELQRKDSTFLDQALQAERAGILDQFAEQNGINEKYLEAMLKDEAATRDLIDEMVLLKNEAQLVREQMAYAANEGKDEYDNSDNQEYINAYIANAMEDSTSKEYKQAQKKVERMSKDELNEAYLNAMGNTDEEYRIKGNKLQKKNEEGKWETETKLTSSEKANLVRDTLIANLDTDTIVKLNRKERSMSANLKKVGIQDETLANKLIVANERGEKADLSQLSLTELNRLNTNMIADADLSKTILLAKNNAIDNWRLMLQEFEGIAANSITSVEMILSSAGHNVGRSAYESYGTMLENIEKYGNKDAANAISQEILSLTQNAPDLGAQLFATIDTIDWTNPEQGLEQLQYEMEVLGCSTDLFALSIDKAGTALGDLNLSPAFLTDLEYASDLFTRISEKWNSLSYGDTLTQDQIDELLAMGPSGKRIVDQYVAKTGKITNYDEATQTETVEYIYEYRGPEDVITNLADEATNGLVESISDELQNYDTATELDALRTSAEVASYGDDKYGYSLAKSMSKFDPDKLVKSGIIEDVNEYNNKMGQAVNASAKLRQMTRGNTTFTNSDAIFDLYNKGVIEINSDGQFQLNKEKFEEYKYDIGALMEEYAATEKELYDNYQYEGEIAQGHEDYDIATAAHHFYSMMYNNGALVDTDTFNGWIVDSHLPSLNAVGLTGIENAGQLTSYAEAVNNVEDSMSYFDQVMSNTDAYVKKHTSEEQQSHLSDNQELLAASAGSLSELNDLYTTQGLITESLYNKYKKQLEERLKGLKDEIDLVKDYNNIIQGNEYAIESLDKKLASSSLSEGFRLLNEKSDTLGSTLTSRTRIAKEERNDRNELMHDIQGALEQAGYNPSELLLYDQMGNITNLQELQETLIAQKDAKTAETISGYIDTYSAAVTDFMNAAREQDQAVVEWASVWSDYRELVEATYEEFNAELDIMNQAIEHQITLIDTLGSEWLGLSNYEEKAINNAAAQISKVQFENAYNNYQSSLELLNALEEKINNSDLTAEEREALEIEYEAQKAATDQALSDMNSAWSNALQTSRDTFAKNIELSLKAFEEGLAGTYGDLEYMSELFSQQSEIREQYLSDYEKVYHLNKLLRDLQKSIDETNSIQGKQALAALQEELNEKQAEGAEVSEYDLEYMQKKYELRLAEIALEEAQNAKSQVRLQKMANGSWGYVYTQNENEIEKAQSDYEEKLFNLQEHNTNYLNTLSEQILSTEKEFMGALQQIYNSDLSDEEKKDRIDALTLYYESRLNYLTEEMDGVLANNEGLTNMVTNFSDTVLGAMYPDAESAEDIFTLWRNNLGNAEEGTGLLGACQSAAEAYADSVDSIFSVLGTTTDGWVAKITEQAENLKDDLTEILDLSAQAAATTGNNTNSMEEGSRDTRQNVLLGNGLRRKDTVSALLKTAVGQNTWTQKKLENMSDDELERAWNEGIAIGAINGYEHMHFSEDFTRDEIINMLKKQASSFVSTYNLTQLTDKELSTLFAQAAGLGYFNRDALDNILRTKWLYPSNFVEPPKNSSLKNLPTIPPQKGGGAVALSPYGARPITFATGGYTGEWGSNGKLAVLHEKELILNAQDTQNLLQTMQVMDQMLRNIELQAAAAAFDHALSATLPKSGSGDILQQEVTIHAEFPNATNHSEIEQAFDTLINRASQFANRNR